VLSPSQRTLGLEEKKNNQLGEGEPRATETFSSDGISFLQIQRRDGGVSYLNLNSVEI
jgi:hypothetical protein